MVVYWRAKDKKPEEIKKSESKTNREEIPLIRKAEEESRILMNEEGMIWS